MISMISATTKTHGVQLLKAHRMQNLLQKLYRKAHQLRKKELNGGAADQRPISSLLALRLASTHHLEEVITLAAQVLARVGLKRKQMSLTQ